MLGHEILLQKLLPLRHFLTKNSINEGNIEWLKKYLEGITLLTSLTYKEKIETIKRVTINSNILGSNTRITEIKHLKYPPKEFVKKFGRANKIEESVLYATFDPITALSEMRPKLGDLITISTWKLKTNYYLTVTPIFKNSTKNGEVHNGMSLRAGIEYNNLLKQYHDEQLRKQLDIIIQFITDCFNKEVEDSNHFDYFLSSHYANRIFWELQNGEIDAILYPSVRQSLTLTNIAIKPTIFDENYSLEQVDESIITQIPNRTSSGWFMSGTGYSKTFDENLIKW
ncbi:hypothetical protein [Flavobacterium oreochromis]|uniref:RES domain-containing protein n=1 Tax=Flavobacterium columnare TaxID=996 RepID=A0A246G749_9FLAO|nr:hypothetical protein [Flavobacterium oreochromis]OWP74135.1 hypothetical protein BWK62_14975 [Flavobacterium oreochromis]